MRSKLITIILFQIKQLFHWHEHYFVANRKTVYVRYRQHDTKAAEDFGREQSQYCTAGVAFTLPVL